MTKYHNISDSVPKMVLRNVAVQTCLRIVSAVAIPKPSVVWNGIYCDIQSFSGNSLCRFTCAADGTIQYGYRNVELMHECFPNTRAWEQERMK